MAPAPVEDARPPAAFIRAVNPVIKAVLRSPAHRLLSGRLMLLTMTGRRTGRTITVPVGRFEQPDGSIVVSASGAWRHNLRGGADVRLTLGGAERAARAELVSPDRKAQAFKEVVDRVVARAIALKVNLDRPPTVEELRPVIARRDLVTLRLTD